MKHFAKTLLFAGLSVAATAQTPVFDEEIVIDDYEPTEFVMPPSPLTTEVIFVGGYDMVQTTETYGTPAGRTIAKEWHDFIGFTPDDSGESLGWVSVNHEQIYTDNHIGDGGGMTAFRIDKDADGNIVVMDQTLDDGRSGKYFNVDFVNTVGETGMNCGGIVGPNGRIWTAEEWFRGSNNSIWNSSARTSSLPMEVAGVDDGYGVRDTAAFTVDAPEFPMIDGQTIAKYDNFNYMTEIDPKQAVAIRKQYNWGRAGWEGGAISNDGKYVYLGIDATPAPWVRFEADTPFDFTQGTLTVYKEDNAPEERWIEVPMNLDNVLGGLSEYALSVGATMFVRNEWVTIDRETGIIYWSETGRESTSSGPGIVFNAVQEQGFPAQPASWHTERAVEFGLTDAFSTEYQDYYGRVAYYDPATHEIGVSVHGGPFFEMPGSGPAIEDYPNKHLSNPDGLNIVEVDGTNFLMIQEDLNQSDWGSMPDGVSNRLCEMYLLPADARNADVEDLIRVTAIPRGAEITGAIQIDENTVLVNSQHPRPSNPFPYNHSCTIAIHGFADVTVGNLNTPQFPDERGIQIYPNPTTREVMLSETTDFAIYNINGKRVRVYRNSNQADVSSLLAGTYFIQTAAGETLKLIIQ